MLWPPPARPFHRRRPDIGHRISSRKLPACATRCRTRYVRSPSTPGAGDIRRSTSRPLGPLAPAPFSAPHEATPRDASGAVQKNPGPRRAGLAPGVGTRPRRARPFRPPRIRGAEPVGEPAAPDPAARVHARPTPRGPHTKIPPGSQSALIQSAFDAACHRQRRPVSGSHPATYPIPCGIAGIAPYRESPGTSPCVRRTRRNVRRKCRRCTPHRVAGSARGANSQPVSRGDTAVNPRPPHGFSGARTPLPSPPKRRTHALDTGRVFRTSRTDSEESARWARERPPPDDPPATSPDTERVLTASEFPTPPPSHGTPSRPRHAPRRRGAAAGPG